MAKPILYIITPVTRPHNLPALVESLDLLRGLFQVMWLPITGKGYADRKIGLADMCQRRNSALEMVERLEPGWIFNLDDDSCIHPEFAPVLADGIQSYPEDRVFFFATVFRSGRSHIVHPMLGADRRHIDTASIVAHTSVARDVRWLKKYIPLEDYWWAHHVCCQAECPVPKLLGTVYYNGLVP